MKQNSDYKYMAIFWTFFTTAIVVGVASSLFTEAHAKRKYENGLIDAGRAKRVFDAYGNERFEHVACNRSHLADSDGYLNWAYGSNNWFRSGVSVVKKRTVGSGEETHAGMFFQTDVVLER